MQRDDVLLAKFGVSPDDIAANQNGYVSKHQRRGLAHQRRLRALMLVAIVLIAIGGEVLLFGVVDARSSAALCVPMLIGVFAIVAFIVTLSQYQGYAADLYKGELAVVEGILHKPRVQFNRIHIIQIEQRYFNIRLSQYRQLEAGHRYRIYYTPYSHTILSVESVEKAKTKGVPDDTPR